MKNLKGKKDGVFNEDRENVELDTLARQSIQVNDKLLYGNFMKQVESGDFEK